MNESTSYRDGMTVQLLIDELQKIQNKELKVRYHDYEVNDRFAPAKALSFDNEDVFIYFHR